MIQVQNLEKHYPDFKLGPLNFKIPTGQVTGFIGENGAGKSTTIKLLLGMVHKDGGTVDIEEELEEHGELDFEKVGVVFDEIKFPGNLKVKEINNVLKLSYSNWDQKSFEDYLRKFELNENKKISELSRGMKMKLQLAAALSHNPDLLIFDEATSGLDPVARDDILEVMRDFIEVDDHAIFVSSHQLQDLEKVADHIIFLHQGKVLADTSLENLLNEMVLIQVPKEDLNRIDAEDIFAYRENSSTAEILLKGHMVQKYPQYEPEDYSIDDLMLICLKGKIL